jgi:hypothetical protein
VALELVVVALGRREYVDDHRTEVEQHPVRRGATPSSAGRRRHDLGDRVGDGGDLALEPPEQMTK